jgi:PKD repeat protein
MKKPILTKITIILILILPVNSIFLFVSANADMMHVSGNIYLDDLPTKPNQIHLILPNQTYLGRLSDDNFYDIYFLNQPAGTTGSFQISLFDDKWIANEKITIKEGIYEYSIDLHITTINQDENTSSPIAITNGPYYGNISSLITFDGSESYDTDGTIIEYIWDFGDGHTQTGVSTTHNYNDNGEYIVVLTVRDDDGLTGFSTTEAIISSSEIQEDQNNPPIAIAGGPYYEIINIPIIFDGSESYDPDGTIIEYIWDFGDGDIGIGETVTHEYHSEGRYELSLKVIDDNIDFNIDTSYVIVTAKPNYPPIKPNIIGPTSIKINSVQSYKAESIDPDGDKISYIFDWGDNSELIKTELFENGTVIELNYTWTSPGLYRMSVYVEDEIQVISEKTFKNILVNSIFCVNIGILIDYTDDGIYDIFESNTTNNKTSVILSQNSYLIDNDGDNNWDYIFDVNSNSLTIYSNYLEDVFEFENILLFFIVPIIIIFILIIIFISYSKKKKIHKKGIFYIKEIRANQENRYEQKSEEKIENKEIKFDEIKNRIDELIKDK